MNKQKLKALLRTSLLYTNLQYTDQQRRKRKSGKKLTQAILNQYLLLALIFTGVYGAMLFTINFAEMPGFFTMYIGLFGLLSLSQGVSVIYNVFFESKDLEAYLPLPFKQLEIFLSKILAVTVTVIPFILPLFVLFSLAAWQAGIFIVLAPILGLFGFLLLLGILLFICALIVLGLTRTKLFQKHKKAVTSGLMFFSTALSVVGILYMQNSNDVEAGTQVFDRTPIAPLVPVHWAITNPFSIQGLIGWASLIALFLVLGFCIKQFFLPRLYEQLMVASTIDTFKKRKRKTGQTTKQILRSYNWQLLKDPNTAMQVLSSSIIFPVVMVATLAGGGLFETKIPNQLAGVTFVAGVLIAYMMCNQTSFVGILISMDRENYDFVMTLPYSKKTYLKEKFRIGFIIQIILSMSVVLMLTLLMKLPLLLVLTASIGAVLGSFVMSVIYFARDYRLLMTDWTSITQLFQRGGGTLAMGILMFVGTFAGMAAVGAYAFATLFYPAWWIQVLVIGSVLLILSGILYYHKRKYLDKVE